MAGGEILKFTLNLGNKIFNVECITLLKTSHRHHRATTHPEYQMSIERGELRVHHESWEFVFVSPSPTAIKVHTRVINFRAITILCHKVKIRYISVAWAWSGPSVGSLMAFWKAPRKLLQSFQNSLQRLADWVHFWLTCLDFSLLVSFEKASRKLWVNFKLFLLKNLNFRFHSQLATCRKPCSIFNTVTTQRDKIPAHSH